MSLTLAAFQTEVFPSWAEGENDCWLGHQLWCFHKKRFKLYQNWDERNWKDLSMENM